MGLVDRLTSRMMSLLGLDFEFSLGLGEPFHHVSPALTLGVRPRHEQIALLHQLGITHVVSCLAEEEQPAVFFLRDEFETLFLPMRDRATEDIGATLTRFLEFVSLVGSGQRVLVHCEVGVSRSATLATAQVMTSKRMRFYEAYRFVRARRPQVLPNVGFAAQLQQFEHTLFPEPRSTGYASLTRYLHEVCNVPVEVEVLHSMLERHDYDAVRAIRAIFGDDIPRVIQGMRL